MSFNHLYKTLGLAPDVSKEEIKEAYLRLVHEYHANAHNSPESEQNFREVCEAYIALSKEKTILIYEQKLKPKYEKVGSLFWQKRYSPAFILGVITIGITGALLGYYVQPKSTIVREIIRETPVVSPVTKLDAEKRLNVQPIVFKQEKSAKQSIQFAKLTEVPLQKAISTDSLLPQAMSNKGLPLLPAIPKSVKVVRILPVPAPLMTASSIHQGPKIEPKKKLMALPSFSPKAIPSVPQLPSNPLLPFARPIQHSTPLPPPQSFTSSNTPHTLPIAAEERESDEKLLAKLNAYDHDKSASLKDEDARILSDLNNLTRDPKTLSLP
ncbi:MAG: DnaJ domain-containing protein [Gloeobacterales cyanobacterium]